MTHDPRMSRRTLLKRSLTVLGAAAVAPAILSACGGDDEGALSCTDTTGLTPDQVATRSSLAYADSTADPNKTCEKCALYTAAPPNQCGSCSVVPGKIHPLGTCNSFAPKTS